MDSPIVDQQPGSALISDSGDVFIYGLVCPLENKVMYVGKSKNLKMRMIQHISDANLGQDSARCEWIRRLQKEGLTPSVLVIEQCPCMEWESRERHWIAHYRSINPKLTNVCTGGAGGPAGLPAGQSTKEKVTLSLSLDAIDVLSRLTTERKRGDFISSLILEAYQNQDRIRRERETASWIAAQMRDLADQIEDEAGIKKIKSRR